MKQVYRSINWSKPTSVIEAADNPADE